MPFGLEAGVNRSIVPGETIAAISTAAGEAAIALIRISGEKAIAVADKVFRGKQRPSDLQSQTQHLGEIVENGAAIDQVRRRGRGHESRWIDAEDERAGGRD